MKNNNFTKLIITILIIVFGFILFISASDPIKKSDQFFSQDKYKEAYEILKSEYDKGNKSFELLWKLTRALKNYSDDFEENKDKRLSMLDEAKKYIEEANNLKPENDFAHYWKAAVLGTIGEIKGPLNAVFLMDPMENECVAAIKYNPNFSRAYYVLGALFVKGRAVVNPFKSSYLKNIGISLIYKAIDLYEKGEDQTDIASLYYHDLIEFLIKRNYSLKSKIKLWNDFKKRYAKETSYKRQYFFYGIMDKPTLSDHDEILKLNQKLQNLKVYHKWDQEKKDDVNKMLKENGF